jgi:hypothetical protein
MKTRWSSALSIVLLGVLTLSSIGDVHVVMAASACNAAAFVTDVTIPDGTYVNPGSTFSKTWRLKNVGTCSWSTSYGVVFVSGERMGANSPVALPRYVSPGQSIDVTVTMVAPTSSGTFRGYWKLQTGSGAQFGVGAAYSNPFWVEIRVRGASTSTVVYDFVAEMCSGTWGYEGGPIPCPINVSKKDYGYVQRVENPVLETGASAGAPALLTIPQNKYNGAIHGEFLVDDIFRGDHFQAIIGCQYQAYNCSVTYQIEYLQGDSMVTLWRFKEQYDGLYYQVDLDLTPIANRKNAILILTVWANGPSTGDQPLWVAPRIVRNINAPSGTPDTPTPAPGTATLTPIPGTGTPGATLVPGCDRAQYVSDITVPDGTTFAPNAPFTKTWRLKNVGSCTWTTGYKLAFVSGDRMGGVETLIPETVVPGQTVDVGVNLTAPNLAGSYRGYWELRNPSGALFGIGSNFDQAFYVDIKVSGSTAGTTALDFTNTVCGATWVSGAGTLPCPGTSGDIRGYVMPVTGPVLENGVTDPRSGLLTVPQSVLNGFIKGTYPPFTVRAGDRFQALLNCQYGAADCFTIFKLDAQIVGGSLQNIFTIGERYDGLYYQVDADLTALAGKNVNFILSMLANGDATGDRAVWVAPRIVRSSSTGGDSGTAVPTTAAATGAAATPTFTVVPATQTQPPTATTAPTTPTATPFGTGWILYNNAKYAFAFQVPPGSNISSQYDTGGRVFLPYTSGTNLTEKYLDLSVVEGASTCKSPYSNPSGTSQTVTYNGVQFLKETGSEGALSNIYDWTGFSTVKGNACISLTFVLHSINPGVYPTPPAVFDAAAESAIFSTIVSTYGNQ